MIMAMVNIWEMQVLMHEILVFVHVTMRFTWWLVTYVLVLMMLIMNMAVFVFDRLMTVFMTVILCQMKPNTKTHESGGNQKVGCKRFMQERYGQCSADKWRC